ncbi:hypothetical protein HELRODRAFT_161916 [Helobdella robusta]|uniref:C2H2-type domain-containing protein n=1 Tax=Helobdella robusta TaxID=6412 RepID=T1ES15_HELRO|nr:hypothetical protein HELRODRAFT_161916 [Helobdella robusta]ESO02628.1 hypothetical protein HELRODRAFT_161916 [Helobdella robusta]
MSKRKEELLAMLKNTLALSRSSLKVAEPDQTEGKCTKGNLGQRSSDTNLLNKNNNNNNVGYNVDDEDEFLYGKSNVFADGSNYGNQRYQNKLEASFDYFHGGLNNEKFTYNSGKNYEFDVISSQEQRPPSRYEQFAKDGTNFYNTNQNDPDLRGYEYSQSVYATEIAKTSTNPFESCENVLQINQRQEETADEIDSNKLLDTILKTISMDEKLSKIIVEKMKKPGSDIGKLNENPPKAAKQEEKLTPVLKSSSQTSIKTATNPSDSNLILRYGAMEKSYEASETVEQVKVVKKPATEQNLDQKLNITSNNSNNTAANVNNSSNTDSSCDTSKTQTETTNWNKKTEEFLKRLQNQNSAPKDTTAVTMVTGTSKADEKKSPMTSTPPQRNKKPPTKEDQLETTDPTKQAPHSSFTDTSLQEIIDTIRAVEVELNKLEQHRQFLLSKLPNPDTEDILKVNLKTQQDMKTQLALLKETLSQVECQKLKSIALNNCNPSNNTSSSSNNDNNNNNNSSKRKRSDDVVEKKLKKSTRSRSRSRGYKRSRSRSRSKSRSRSPWGRKQRWRRFDSRNSRQHRKFDQGSRSRSGSRKNTSKSGSNFGRDNKDNSKSKLLTNTSPDTLASTTVKESTKQPTSSTAASKETCTPTAEENVTNQAKPVTNLQVDQSLNASEAIQQKDMLQNVKFGIEFAIALFMKASKFFDGGNLWCEHCDLIFESFGQLCLHLHTEEHLHKSEDIGTKKKSDVLERDQPSGPQSAPARGNEFIRPVQAYCCSLCDEFLEDSSKAKMHFTSSAHNSKFKEYVAKNNAYEVPYLARRMNALFKKECVSKVTPRSILKSADPVVDMFEDSTTATATNKLTVEKKVGNVESSSSIKSVAATGSSGVGVDATMTEAKMMHMLMQQNLPQQPPQPQKPHSFQPPSNQQLVHQQSHPQQRPPVQQQQYHNQQRPPIQQQRPPIQQQQRYQQQYQLRPSQQLHQQQQQQPQTFKAKEDPTQQQQQKSVLVQPFKLNNQPKKNFGGSRFH